MARINLEEAICLAEFVAIDMEYSSIDGFLLRNHLSREDEAEFAASFQSNLDEIAALLRTQEEKDKFRQMAEPITQKFKKSLAAHAAAGVAGSL